MVGLSVWFDPVDRYTPLLSDVSIIVLIVIIIIISSSSSSSVTVYAFPLQRKHACTDTLWTLSMASGWIRVKRTRLSRIM